MSARTAARSGRALLGSAPHDYQAPFRVHLLTYSPIDTATGAVQFDNFGGHWGDAQQLDRFLQAYAVEKTKLEARKQGHSVSEQLLADGSIQVRIQTAA